MLEDSDALSIHCLRSGPPPAALVVRRRPTLVVEVESDQAETRCAGTEPFGLRLECLRQDSLRAMLVDQVDGGDTLRQISIINALCSDNLCIQKRR